MIETMGTSPAIVAAGAALRAKRSALTVQQSTTEAFIHGVREIVIARALSLHRITDEEAARLSSTKLVYGVGAGTGARGVCYYGIWTGTDGAKVDMVEITALGQESWVQLAGTTVHELAHVIAGHPAGHAKAWAARAVDLGFMVEPKAAGQVYWLTLFSPALRDAITTLVRTLTDGRPNFAAALGYGSGLRITTPRPCSAGIGTRGGKSRGVGSGSRLRLYECQCATHDGRPGAYKVRVASDTFEATCGHCGAAFEAR